MATFKWLFNKIFIFFWQKNSDNGLIGRLFEFFSLLQSKPFRLYKVQGVGTPRTYRQYLPDASGLLGL